MTDLKVSKKAAQSVMNGGAFIEKLVAIIESRAGRLVGAMSQPDKSWITPETATRLHGRLTSVIRTLSAAQAVIEANLPRPKVAERAPSSALDALLGGMGRVAVVGLPPRPKSDSFTDDGCLDPNCDVHGNPNKKTLS